MVQQGVALDTFNSPDEKKIGALKFYTSFAIGDNSVWDTTLDNSLLAFSKGKVAIYFGYSWDVFAIQKLNSNLNFKVYPVPQLSGIKTTIASYWVEGVSAKSKNQKEAYEFMKYLAQKDTAEKFYTESAKTRAFGEPYARKDLRESVREDPLVYPFLSGLDDASSTIFSSDTHDGDTGMDTVLNNYLGDAINSIVTQSDSPDSTVQKLNSGVNQTLEKYGVLQPQQ
jgi:multiple sugar transport system substrate-binding protein